MTLSQTIITIALISLATMLTRFLPFILFPAHRKPPKYIEYLGTVLPYAVMGLLLIYCLKDALLGTYFALPEILAIILIIILHNWRKNTFLSIGAGTIFYMVLVQNFF